MNEEILEIHESQHIREGKVLKTPGAELEAEARRIEKETVLEPEPDETFEIRIRCSAP